MKVHELRPPAGSTRPRRRVGRGIAGKGGKTAGRGTKGQGARDTIPMGFEGGQLPLMQRIPKLRGFKNPFRIDYTPVNLSALQALEGDHIDLAAIVAGGLARKSALVKILGGGELTRAIRVEAHAFSKTAEAAITASGGSITVIPLPFGNGRPPAQGNALTNR
ncbi:MAG TPA: 50S ribosomal protein L15 [Acidimicrobiales bacterium]|jgi:large subunit ribosomal protein L15|nr:50S ribosomal protein L15 [Acidimicrobiales bacterium]